MKDPPRVMATSKKPTTTHQSANVAVSVIFVAGALLPPLRCQGNAGQRRSTAVQGGPWMAEGRTQPGVAVSVEPTVLRLPPPTRRASVNDDAGRAALNAA